MSSIGRSGRGRALLAGGIAALGAGVVALVAFTGGDDGFVELDPPVADGETTDQPTDMSTPVSEPIGDRGSGDEPDVERCGGAPSAKQPGSPGLVVFSEIHYHPPGDGDGFVELFNPGGEMVDVGGWRIQGLDHCLPSGTRLAPDGLIVITESEAAGRLDNGGEELALVDANGTAIDVVEYDDRELWPAIADGHGASLHRLSAASDGGAPANWVAREPEPGSRGADEPTLPVWGEVSHTVLPEPGEAISIEATLSGVSDARAEVSVRFGFDEEVTFEMSIGADGVATATIPGQDAGALIRYRLVAKTPDGVVGSWPRQGAGASYVGTTVATPAADDGLATFEWFMQEPEFQVAFNDRAPGRDVTYSTVIAVAGEVFDNAQIRIKGQSSRTFPKPKWKVELAPGQRLEIEGVIDRWVDEFAWHSGYNDKSALREVLSHELFADAGVPVSDAFPVRVLRNGEFYGLHTYVEQPDARWRDRADLDGAVYEVGDRSNTTLAAGEADLVGEEFDWKFQREAGDDDDDDALRGFVRELDEFSEASVDPVDRRAWIFDNVDVPGVVNALAASALIQQQDLRTKNFRLAQVDDRWTVLPFDLDLTWGRLYGEGTCAGLCDDVVVSSPDQFIATSNALFAAFTDDPILRDMTRTRVAVLRDTLLEPSRVASRVDELLDQIGDAAELDRAEWGTYGEQQSIEAAAEQLVSDFAIPQYERLRSPGAPADVDQADSGDLASVVVAAVDDDMVRLLNSSSVAVDVSELTVEDATVLPGLVLTPGLAVELDGRTVVRWIEPER
ncbi:MAG: CotH kinase family protein [Ilumatobacter sp.]